ncbi:MAG: alpha/beta family hydrolase [Cellulomonas sp.]
MRTISVDTPVGAATAHLSAVAEPRGTLVLGHGAGGGIGAPDLVAVAGAAREAGFTVVLVEQPYRVAGRRAPPRSPALDAAWTAVIDRLRRDEIGSLDALPLVVGGRSSGARVACRTATAVGATGVLCLAFPLQPRPRAGKAAVPSRLPELDLVSVPVLVVQGDHDPFGTPPAATNRAVVIVRGDHSLRTGLPEVAAATHGWLTAGATGSEHPHVSGYP